MLRTPKVRHAAVKYLSKRTTRLVIEEEEENAPDSGSEGDMDMRGKAASLEIKEASNAFKSQAQSFEEREANLSRGNISGNEAAKKDETAIVEDDAVTIPNSDVSEPKKIEQEDTVPELEDDSDLSVIQIEYPNKSSLVINALIAGLEDENTLVQRITLDYMHSHFKLSCDLFSESEKCILVEATLRLLIRKDLSLTRRIYTWMFGPPDLENKYQITEGNQ